MCRTSSVSESRERAPNRLFFQFHDLGPSLKTCGSRHGPSHHLKYPQPSQQCHCATAVTIPVRQVIHILSATVCTASPRRVQPSSNIIFRVGHTAAQLSLASVCRSDSVPQKLQIVSAKNLRSEHSTVPSPVLTTALASAAAASNVQPPSMPTLMSLFNDALGNAPPRSKAPAVGLRCPNSLHLV